MSKEKHPTVCLLLLEIAYTVFVMSVKRVSARLPSCLTFLSNTLALAFVHGTSGIITMLKRIHNQTTQAKNELSTPCLFRNVK